MQGSTFVNPHVELAMDEARTNMPLPFAHMDFLSECIRGRAGDRQPMLSWDLPSS